jgi:flavin-dependent dehydrogenase
MIDLIVAGAGPAGLFTAVYANAAGLTVRVIEPRPSPIDKACGEGLMPGAVALLAELGLRTAVELPGRPFAGIRYVDGDRAAEARFATGSGWGMRRDLLQGSMFRLAERAGVEFVEGSVDHIEQTTDRVSAAGATARYLVAADGLHSRIRTTLGLQRPDHGKPRWGLRRHLQVEPWTDCVEVHWSPDAEAYLTPLGDGWLSVAVLTGNRGSFGDQLASFPELADRVKGAVGDQVRGAGPLRQRVGGRVAGRVLLVGDAAGYLDALSGEGIDVAARSARELVRCLVAGRPQDYDRAWARVTRRYRFLTGALLAIRRRQFLQRHLVGAAARQPRLFRAAVHQLTR